MAFAFTALKWMNRREQEIMKIMADTNTVAHIRAYLLNTGHRFTGESEAFEAVIRALYSEGRQVSNQAIILRLRDEQASTADKTGKPHSSACCNWLPVILRMIHIPEAGILHLQIYAPLYVRMLMRGRYQQWPRSFQLSHLSSSPSGRDRE